MAAKHHRDLEGVPPVLSPSGSLQTLASCTQATGTEEERSFQTNSVTRYQSRTWSLTPSRRPMTLWGELFLSSVYLLFYGSLCFLRYYPWIYILKGSPTLIKCARMESLNIEKLRKASTFYDSRMYTRRLKSTALSTKPRCALGGLRFTSHS